MSATTRLRQSQSLGTTLAQRPTATPFIKPRMRVGATMPTRLTNPPSMVQSLRPPVAVPPEGVAPFTVSPADATLLQMEADVRRAAAGDNPLLRMLFGFKPGVQPTMVDSPSRLSIWDQIRMFPQGEADAASVFAQNAEPLNAGINELAIPSYATPVEPGAQMVYSGPEAPVAPVQSVAGASQPQPQTRSVTTPELLMGLTPPTRDAAAETKSRDSSMAIASALPLIAALFGGDMGAAFRNTPLNLAAAVSGSRVGADNDFTRAVQQWQLSQGAIDTENQRRQTNFANEGAIEDRAIREARDFSLANSRAGQLILGQQREGRLSNGQRIRQTEADRQAFNKGLEYLRTLQSDEERTAALSDPNLLASFGFDELSPQEAEILATLSKRERPGATQEQRALLSELGIWASRWVDPLIRPEDKPRIWGNMQRLLGALGSPNAETGGKAIIPSAITPQQQEQNRFSQGNLDVAIARLGLEQQRLNLYAQSLRDARAKKGEDKTKSLRDQYDKIQKELDEANLKNRKENVKRLVDDATFSALSPEAQNEARAANEGHQAYIDFLFDRKEELEKELGILPGGSPPPVAHPGTAPTTAPTTGGKPTAAPAPKPAGVPAQPKSAGSRPQGSRAGVASRQTNPHRQVNTPAKTPPASKTGGGQPTALTSVPVLSGVSTGAGSVVGLAASTPNGVPTAKVYRPKAAGKTTAGKPTGPRPATPSKAVSRISVDGETFTVRQK